MKMQHSLIALALAGAMAAPVVNAAETSLYGSIRMSLKGVDAGDGRVWDLVNNASRLGFKGSSELDNGLTVVGQYEMGVNADKGVFGAGTATNRLSYVGLKGGFGEVYAGSQWAPYYLMVGGLTDKFSTVGAQHIRKVFRIADTVQYKNSFGPVALAGALSFDGESGESGVDRAQLAAQFALGDFTLALGMENLSQEANGEIVDGTTTGIGGIYKSGAMAFAATYQMVEASVESTAEDQDKMEVYGEYNVGSNTYRASYGQTDSGDNTPSTVALGFDHKLNDQAKVWVEGQFDDLDAPGADNPTAIAVGMRYDW